MRSDSNEGTGELSKRDGRAVAGAWGGAFLLGLLLVIAGVVSLLVAAVASFSSILFFGIMLVVAAGIEIVYAVRVGRQGRFLLYFLAGVLSLVTGILCLTRPVASLSAVTLLLTMFFFCSGLFRLLTSVLDRYPGWGSDAITGLAAIALGAIVVASWPLSALWLVGTLVGVEILIRGMSLMSASLILRRVLRTQRAT